MVAMLSEVYGFNYDLDRLGNPLESVHCLNMEINQLNLYFAKYDVDSNESKINATLIVSICQYNCFIDEIGLNIISTNIFWSKLLII